MIKNVLLQYIRDEGPAKKEELIKVFEIGKREKKDFYKVLEQLVNEDKIILDEKTGEYSDIFGEGSILLEGVLQGNEKGFGFLLQDEEDVFIPKSGMNGALDGDTVKVIPVDNNIGHSREGRVVKIVKRGREQIVGIYQDQKNFGFVVPDEKRFYYDVFIPSQCKNGAKNGQKVIVKIKKWPSEDKKPEGEIVDILGYPGEKLVDVMSVAASSGIPMHFTPKEINAAKRVPQEVNAEMIEGRRDLRDITTFTIDGWDSKDFDDAVSIEKLENGNYLLGVHIADVSHYVKLHDDLDKEAYKRGNSVYLIDKVIPMLPEELSNGICSLNEGVDRLTMSVLMEVNHRGTVENHEIVESVINSSRRLVYDNVSDFIEDGIVDKSIKGLEEDLTLMGELQKILAKKRDDRGSIDFDFPESKIIVDSNGHPTKIERDDRRIANKIIEEFMILTNEVVSEEYFWMEIPFLYRIHEEPGEERVEELNKTVRRLGYKLNTQNISSRDFQNLIEDVRGTDEYLFVSNLILRSLKKAKYSNMPLGHFGLASKYYSHFTSPIRRYADLTIHRIIKDNIHARIDGREIKELNRTLPITADHISETEIVAQNAERTVESIKMAEYMSDRIGKEYDGVISSVTRFGIFVQLPNTIEGLVSYEAMKDDYYEFDPDNYVAIGQNNRKTLYMGMRVKVKTVSTDVIKGNVDFELI